ncbi:hypothetical protein EOD41_14610 [Mucilaginibacter limnophilus]|uniref:Outer membrane protein beta-barrel domain-containing protein n=1 Tax=Mucilaginibacter limnophilus TaxID=1932778 RepID=A0A437MRB0_9SPHI|nr:hypothetical protein [Mucilaginibacter limnophilus]RVU00187.1 hypothetical protein EOD41_14610 [Mucilaginibacter limnophilus]
MKKILLVLLVFAALKVQAQSVSLNKAFSVGLELGIPSQSIYNIGFGGSGKAEVPIASPVSLTITAGYTSFYYKSALIGGGDRFPDAAGYVPLKGGAKVYLSRGVYAEAEGGAVLETNYAKKTLSAFSIGPGFLIPLKSDNQSIDFSLRYERWSNNLKQTGIRVAYRFGW